MHLVGINFVSCAAQTCIYDWSLGPEAVARYRPVATPLLTADIGKNKTRDRSWIVNVHLESQSMAQHSSVSSPRWRPILRILSLKDRADNLEQDHRGQECHVFLMSVLVWQLICGCCQGELMNGMRPWRPTPPPAHSEPPQHTTSSALPATEHLAAADHLPPSSVDMSTDWPFSHVAPPISAGLKKTFF